jgi:drug/metabolite transporter (DMT)-like permease
MNTKSVNRGILAGIGAGVFWGLPFLVPQVLHGVPAFELAFGRFFFFGLISLFWLKPVLRILAALSWRERLHLAALSALGFWLYTMILFYGVQATDGIFSSLILGLLPITIPLFSPGRKNSGPTFWAGLSLILSGLLALVFWPVWSGDHVLRTPALSGIAALLLCLTMWTAYAILNSRFLQAHPEIKRKDQASVMGVVSIGCMLPIFLIRTDLGEFIHQESFGLYLACSIALGVGASWFANWLWNICSFHTRSEVSGTLLVFETVFGLIYSFAYEGRPPHPHEGVVLLLFAGGVALTIRSQR